MARSSNPSNVQTPGFAPSTMQNTGASSVASAAPATTSAQPNTGASSVASAAPATTSAQPNIFGQSAGAYTSAINAANAVAGFNAPRVGTKFGYTPDTVEAQSAIGGMAQYYNPYEQQVIDASMADLERQRMMQMAQMGAQATAAGAFGGSRQGVAQALTNEGFANQGGQLSSQLRLQGFNTALGASQQDVANYLQSALANQAARASQEQFSQGSRLQAQQANQAAAIQAANMQLAASGQLGGLANSGFNMGNTIIQNQANAGAAQQASNQALIDAIRNQYGNFTNSSGQSLATLLGAASGSNMGQGTTTQTQNPGFWGTLAAGAGLLGGI